MASKTQDRRQIIYEIDAQPSDVLEIKASINEVVWDIARENGLEENLHEADFDIYVGQTAPDVGIVIEVIVSFVLGGLANNLLNHAIDETWKVLLDKVQKKYAEYGKNALKEKSNVIQKIPILEEPKKSNGNESQNNKEE